MTYKILVMLHLLGSAVWIGGHIVLVSVILPASMKRREVEPILEFERAYGAIAKVSLLVQVVSGLWLATRWLGNWGSIFSAPTPAAHLVLTKLALLGVTLALAVHANLRVLPRLSPQRIQGFALHVWLVTLISVLMLIVGAGIRTGGLM